MSNKSVDSHCDSMDCVQTQQLKYIYTAAVCLLGSVWVLICSASVWRVKCKNLYTLTLTFSVSSSMDVPTLSGVAKMDLVFHSSKNFHIFWDLVCIQRNLSHFSSISVFYPPFMIDWWSLLVKTTLNTWISF